MKRIIALLLSALLLVRMQVASTKDLDPAEVDAARKAGKSLPEDDAVRRAQAKRPGKVSAVRVERKYGRYVYEVDIVDDADAKWEVQLDAKNGTIISNKPHKQEDNAADEDDD